MIPKIKKILYTTDLSQNSAYALRYAVNSATQHDAGIYILHVIKTRVFPMGKLSAPEIEVPAERVIYADQMSRYPAEQIRLAKEEIETRIREFCRKELPGGEVVLSRIVSVEVVEGDPAVRILEKVDELKADMVVMGTHGKGILAYTFLGSVAQKVLQRIRIPVYMIPIPEKTDIAFKSFGQES